jgi:hypothetical protein
MDKDTASYHYPPEYKMQEALDSFDFQKSRSYHDATRSVMVRTQDLIAFRCVEFHLAAAACLCLV